MWTAGTYLRGASLSVLHDRRFGGENEMTDSGVIELGQRTVIMALTIVAPALIASLGVGLIISIFQAATQIQEMTITFVPKIVAVGLVVMFFGPWMIHKLMAFTVQLFNLLPELVH